jgi:pimeloyl-ACP methyl ester carboxylesterase
LYGGLESLEGDQDLAGQAFRTPLATLHGFNGWADMFLATPDAGLEDAFAGLRGKAGAWTWDVLYHDFSAQSGSTDYGTELDLSLSRKLAERYGLLLKAARFEADNAAYTDTTKFWLQLSAEY